MKKRLAEMMPIIIKVLLLAIGVVGQISTYDFTGAGQAGGNFMAGSHFLFYTNMSNIWIMAIIAVFLVYDILSLTKGSSAPTAPNWLYALRFVFTSAIMLTFVVFSLLLTPEMIAGGNSGYLLSVSNLCVHNLVPILAIIDWCLYGYNYKTGKKAFMLGAIPPLGYAAFALTLSAFGNFFSGRNVPYFFFDYKTNGWLSIGGGKLGTVWWIIIISAAVFAMSALLIAAKNSRAAVMEKRREK